MTLLNAKVLHKHFIKLERFDAAEQLERRFPELAKASKSEVKKKDEPKPKG